jgi:hypothetical protein
MCSRVKLSLFGAPFSAFFYSQFCLRNTKNAIVTFSSLLAYVNRNRLFDPAGVYRAHC